VLSNVTVKSNVLPAHYQEWLGRISAIDLHDVYLRCPLLPVSFDPTHTTLTEKQQREWTARLFWREKEVTIEHEGRGTQWMLDLARDALPEWRQARDQLNEEVAIEWLWLCVHVIIGAAQPSPAGEQTTRERIRQVMVSLLDPDASAEVTPASKATDFGESATLVARAVAVGREAAAFLAIRHFDERWLAQRLCDMLGV